MYSFPFFFFLTVVFLLWNTFKEPLFLTEQNLVWISFLDGEMWPLILRASWWQWCYWDPRQSFLEHWDKSRRFKLVCTILSAFQIVLMVKNLHADGGDIKDVGLIPGLRRSPGRRMATHSSILAWRIPWTEESGRLQSIGLHRVGHDWSDLAHMHVQFYSKVSSNIHITPRIAT